MRNVSDKGCRQNQNTHFMYFFLTVLLLRRCGQILQTQTGHRWQSNMTRVLHAG